VLLHGWEGSSESLYVLSLGQYLFERGYDIVRLNLRDHGASHHLNRGLFHSCLLPEVIGAARDIGRMYARSEISLVGFSLGGNFALRVGARARAEQITLRRVVAVSPVIDPARTLLALESGLSLYRNYFIHKWRRSLRKKQKAWPTDFDFAPFDDIRSLTEMTDRLIREHTDFSDLVSYLRGYAITGEVLRDLSVPSLIIASTDDPIIPCEDLMHICANELLRIELTRYGGHCGFRQGLFGGDWLERRVLEELERCCDPLVR
jgi:uncharacterized protein